MKFRKLKGNCCNGCEFGWFNLHRKPTISVEQIIKGAYLDLCKLHFISYMGRRLKWFLNEKSGYRLEKLTKWWIN